MGFWGKKYRKSFCISYAYNLIVTVKELFHGVKQNEKKMVILKKIHSALIIHQMSFKLLEWAVFQQGNHML